MTDHFDQSGGVSLFSALRDAFIARLPLKKLSEKWSRRFYGNSISFVFLTHPRDEKEILRVFPFSRILKRILPAKLFYKILSLCPAYIVARLKSPEGYHGAFVSTPLLPEELFADRNRTLRNAGRILDFIKKISTERVYIGLAAWWPIVTNGGAALTRYIDVKDNIIITNGHCATLASLILSTEKILATARRPLSRSKILIIGAGKMGGAVAAYFKDKVSSISLVDQNLQRLERIKREISAQETGSEIELIEVTKEDFAERVVPALKKTHITICTTSNIGYVLEESTLIKDCVVLDDARPEAFKRIIDREQRVAVLEGGLMKVPGMVCSMDFGFGERDNIFGCLAEAYLLRLDGMKSLKPTLGEVEMANLHELIRVCQTHGITHGDFKCGHMEVEPEFIAEIVNLKK